MSEQEPCPHCAAKAAEIGLLISKLKTAEVNAEYWADKHQALLERLEKIEANATKIKKNKECMHTNIIATIAVAAALCACGPKPDTPMAKQSPIDSWRPAATFQENPAPAVNAGRVELTRIGVVEDDAAYNGRRAIYVIVDRKTGQEFIGVSGIGISETGSHQCGKSRCTHEQ